MNTNNDMLQTINQAMTSMASQPNQMRIMEQRSALLMDFLKEHGLAEPKSVKHEPLVGCEIEQCFRNVEAQVKVAGGSMETGWAFCEEIDVSIHTIAHAVWITPWGRRMDITPWRHSPLKRILFLPDAKVAVKRGYSAGCCTVIAKDPFVRSMLLFNRGLDQVFEDFVGAPGTSIDIPEARFKDLAARVGFPWPLAQAIATFRLCNSGH